MWLLNYCAPFLSNDPQIVLIRKLLLGQILLLFLIYISLRLFYLCSTPKIVQPDPTAHHIDQPSDAGALPPQNALQSKPVKQFIMFGKNVPSSRQFKRSFAILLGHHAVAVASCMLYSPFVPQMVMAALYMGLCCTLLLFVMLQYRKWATAAYVLMALTNLSLLFSAVLGVGASKFDSLKMQCNWGMSL